MIEERTKLSDQTIDDCPVGSLLYSRQFLGGVALLLTKTLLKDNYYLAYTGGQGVLEYWAIRIVDGEGNVFSIDIEEYDIFF
jgi:hypothetical protein